MDRELRALIGYERRLYKMRRPALLAEAERVGVQVSETIAPIILLSDLVKLILDAQDINPDILKDPPQ